MTFFQKTGVHCISVLVALFLLASCGPGRKTADQHVSLDTIQVNASNNPIDIYRATAPREWEISHARIALSFNFREKTASGREWLKLHPYFYNVDSLVLDAKGMRIDSVSFWGEAGSAKLNYVYKDDHLTIKFPKPYIASDTARIYIVYKAMPYAEPVGGSSAITEDRGLYFINTDNAIPNKPVQVWTQGETESNSHWMPTIDKPTTRFTFQLELEVPDTMQTLSNGYLASSVETGKMGIRRDIWIMDKPIQAYAAMFAIGRYSIVKDSWQGKEVNYYVEKEFAPYAKLMFRNTPEMIDFFSNVTGVSYPWSKYDQIVVRDYVSGAMENTGAVIFGEFMNQNARQNADHDYEDIVSHELFHMWFGDYVTCESWSNLTLNESFATYGEYLWRNYKYGKNSGDRLNYLNFLKYLSQAERNDPPLLRYHYADREDMFDRISYEKGSVILHYLHSLVGDDAFFKAMQLYLTRNALHSAEVAQWRLAVEEVTGRDWNWFFDQWYNHGGHPILDMKYNYDDAAQKLTITVTQKQDSLRYKLTFKSVVIYGPDKQLVDWNITAGKQTFTYAYRNGTRPTVVPDVLHWLPAVIHEDKPMKNWLEQYVVGSDYVTRRHAIDAAYKKISDSSSQVIIDRALQERLNYIRSYALAPLLKITDDHLQRHWYTQVAYLAAEDADNEVRARAFQVLGEWKYSAAKQEMIHAVTDSSYNVAGAALMALYKVEKDTAYYLAKKMLDTDPKSELENAIWDIISERADSGDFAIYEAKAAYAYGGQKISLASSIESYLENVKSDTTFDRGLKLLTQMANNEPIEGYRYYLGYFIARVAKAYKDKKETALTKQRFASAKNYYQQVVGAEKDEDNRKKYADLAKEMFPDKK